MLLASCEGTRMDMDGTTRFAVVCPTQATLTDAPRAPTPSAPGCRPDAPGPGSKEAESTAASHTKGRARHGKKKIFGVRLAEGADLDVPHDGAGRVVQELHAHLRAGRRVSPSRAARARDTGVSSCLPCDGRQPRGRPALASFFCFAGGSRTCVTPPREPVRPKMRVTLASWIGPSCMLCSCLRGAERPTG